MWNFHFSPFAFSASLSPSLSRCIECQFYAGNFQINSKSKIKCFNLQRPIFAYKACITDTCSSTLNRPPPPPSPSSSSLRNVAAVAVVIVIIAATERQKNCSTTSWQEPCIHLPVSEKNLLKCLKFSHLIFTSNDSASFCPGSFSHLSTFIITTSSPHAKWAA